MVGTTIATMILTEVSAVANLGCQAFLRTRFLPFNVRYNIYKGEINFPGCKLATKATSNSRLSGTHSYGPQMPLV